MRERDLGPVLGGALLLGLAAHLGAIGLIQGLDRPATLAFAWCALLPLAYGILSFGLLAPLARRITARGGLPEVVFSAVASLHVAVTVVALMVHAAGARGSITTLYGAAFPGLLAIAASVVALGALGTRPAPVAVPPGEPDPASPTAVAALPRLSWTLAAAGVAAPLIGGAIATAATLGAWSPLGAWYAGAAALALAGGTAAFARAIRLPGHVVAGLAAFMLVPAALWGAAGAGLWQLAPLALGLTTPYLRVAAAAAARAATLAAVRRSAR